MPANETKVLIKLERIANTTVCQTATRSHGYIAYLRGCNVAESEKTAQQLEEELEACKRRLKELTEASVSSADIVEQLGLFRNLLQMIDAVVWITSAETGELLYINDTAEEIYGLSISEMRDNPQFWKELIHPDDRDVMLDDPSDWLKEDRDENSYRIVRPDGEIRWLLDKKYVMRTDADKPEWIGGLAVDITERKVTRQRLRAQAERFRIVADFTYDWEYWVSPEGDFVYVSPACERITGYGVNDFKEDPRLLENIAHTDDREKVRRHLHNESAPSEVLSLQFRIITKNGKERWIEHVCQPVHGAEGQWLGRRASNRDITERKLAQDKLARQAEEILELSTPTMQVWDSVLAAPLIGTLDTQRTQRFMEVLLHDIVDTGSEIALIDLTGVPTIDTQTARFIIETIDAVRLLGADVILTGVRPSIAQTLVHLGIDLSGITTRSSLVAGLRVALKALNLEMIDRDNVVDSGEE